MRYRIQTFNKRGDEDGPPRHVPEQSQEIPGKKIRQLLDLPTIKAVEIHHVDGSSIEYSKRCR